MNAGLIILGVPKLAEPVSPAMPPGGIEAETSLAGPSPDTDRKIKSAIANDNKRDRVIHA